MYTLFAKLPTWKHYRRVGSFCYTKQRAVVSFQNMLLSCSMLGIDVRLKPLKPADAVGRMFREYDPPFSEENQEEFLDYFHNRKSGKEG